MQQIWQAVPVFLAFSLYNNKDTHIGEYFLALLHDKKGPMTLVSTGQFLQFVLDEKF